MSHECRAARPRHSLRSGRSLSLARVTRSIIRYITMLLYITMRGPRVRPYVLLQPKLVCCFSSGPGPGFRSAISFTRHVRSLRLSGTAGTAIRPMLARACGVCSSPRAHARFARFRAQSFFARNHVSTLLPAPHGVVAGFRPRAMEETSSYPMPSRAYRSAHMSWPPSSDSAIVLNGSVLRTASRHPRSGWQWPASPPGNS